jgi:hypothetical protein
MVESLPEDVSWMIVRPELRRRAPSPSTKMPKNSTSPGMVTVVTVASRTVRRARLTAKHAVIFERVGFLRLRWSLEASVSQERSLLKPKSNKQTFDEVDLCCAGGSTKARLKVVCKRAR